MDVFLQAVWGGAVVGVTYAVLALGFTLIFGVLGVLQFSHPQIFVAGGFVGYAVQTTVGGGVLVVLPITMAACALIGLVVERVAIRPLKRSSFLTPAIATIAAGIVIQNAVVLLRGPDPVSFPALVPEANVHLVGVSIRSPELCALGIGVALMAGLQWLIHRTRFGQAMRATAERPDVAQAFGVNTRLVATTTMALASSLAGAAAVLLASVYGTLSPFMDTSLGFKGLVIMVVAGLASIRGSMAVGVLLGVLETLLAQYVSPAYRDVFVWALLLLVLVVRPAGIFGARALVKV